MPVDSKNKSIDTNTLSQLLIDFQKEFKLLDPIKDLKAFNDTLYHLLQKYASRIAAFDTQSVDDISLFDESRIQAAKYICDQSLEGEQKKYLLIKGGLSGIQKFIYADVDTTEAGRGKGTAKNLRGKSFYVALFTDFIAEHLVQELTLTEANIIFSGGGQFYIVAPETPDTLKTVQGLEEKINLFIIENIGTSLNLVLANTSCEDDLFEQADKYFQFVNESLERNKLKKFKDYLKETFDAFRQPKKTNE